MAALLRRIPRHRHRRRDDPRAVVQAAVRARRGGGGDLERASRTSSTRTGLNRALFLPFIALIEEHMEVVRAGGAHRLPAGEARRRAGVARAGAMTRPMPRSTQAWQRPPAGSAGAPLDLDREGPHGAGAARAAWAWRDSHSTICCEQPLAALDYLRIAHDFRTHRARPHPGDGFRSAQRGQALHHPDRHALRQRGEARGLGRRRARRALPRRRGLRGARSSGAPRRG